MFTSDVPSYVIDLQADEAQRWREVITGESDSAQLLADEAAAGFKQMPEIIRWLLGKLYEKSLGGRYQTEIDAWASTLHISRGTAILLNCAYELSHVSLKHPVRKLFGCTAGVRWVEGLGMVHVRNLDWPLTNLGNATCLFRFQQGRREFIVVGIAGFVGVLSGMLPGRYSITLNWAPPVSQPAFKIGPAFLLRETLEKCDSYAEAVELLSKTSLSTSVFFTVCGAEKGQACVIERTQSEASVRELRDAVIVQANHHVANYFASNNEELGEESCLYSQERAKMLEEALQKLTAACSLDDVAATLQVEPTLNDITYQQMAFCPDRGEVKAWRRLVDSKNPTTTSLNPSA